MGRGCRLALVPALAIGAWSCSKPRQVLTARPVGSPIAIEAPLGLPPVPVPAGNPTTAEAVALGAKLFFSKRLSADGTLACASCHDPQTGFADRRPVSAGVGGKTGKRNAPTVRNAAYWTSQFWDGRAASLEQQAAGPMMNALEMAHTLEGVERDVSADPELRPLFEAAFGKAPDGQSPVTLDRISAALAAFQRKLVAGNSPWDRFYFGKQPDAISASARRGWEVFRDAKRGNCVVCHTVEDKFALFTDQKFHNIGVGLNAEGELADLGRYDVTRREEDRGAFRTPTLRNVAETAPYMHDGSLKTLKDVVDFYVGGGSSNPHLDKEIRPLSHLTRQDREDLVAFLESLTGGAP